MEKLNVLLVGAGEINFGSADSGPWNHTLRLERKLGARLNVVAIIDIDTNRATMALERKLNSDLRSSYTECRIYNCVEAARADMDQDRLPALVILGVPPSVRGSDVPGQDLELQIANAFPSSALFIEKPISSGSEAACWRVAEELDRRGTLVGVGYMLRYLKAVQKMKEIIREHNLALIGTSARYIMAYDLVKKSFWWDKSLSGGPIIEQATHVCDLSRYFGGEIVDVSVVAHTVEYDEPAGRLLAQSVDEALIVPENRLPRLTSATWKYSDGAVGELTHIILLHGTTYETEFDVYADGYHMKLSDLYGTPTLHVRRPGATHPEVFTYNEDDPFYSELSTFIDVLEGEEQADGPRILSSYADAIRTYEMTWNIRRASEDAVARRRSLTVS